MRSADEEQITRIAAEATAADQLAAETAAAEEAASKKAAAEKAAAEQLAVKTKATEKGVGSARWADIVGGDDAGEDGPSSPAPKRASKKCFQMVSDLADFYEPAPQAHRSKAR